MIRQHFSSLWHTRVTASYGLWSWLIVWTKHNAWRKFNCPPLGALKIVVVIFTGRDEKTAGVCWRLQCGTVVNRLLTEFAPSHFAICQKPTSTTHTNSADGFYTKIFPAIKVVFCLSFVPFSDIVDDRKKALWPNRLNFFRSFQKTFGQWPTNDRKKTTASKQYDNKSQNLLMTAYGNAIKLQCNACIRLQF